MRSSQDQPWAALNRVELARDTKGNDVAQELAEAREKTEIAVAKANLLIQQREGTENDLALLRAELKRLTATVERLDASRSHPSSRGLSLVKSKS